MERQDDPAPALADAAVNVLVVDDRPENRLALKAVLPPPHYRIVEAGSGPEALRRLLDEEFAMLLIDVVMPEMSGFELANAVRQRERTASIPILFLTAQATDVDLIYKGYSVGAVDYLLKPLMPEIVRSKAAVFADAYRQRKRLERQAAQLLEAGRREGELRLVELRMAGERRYRNLAESIPHIVWTASPDGKVDYVNRRWYEHTGTSVEQAAGDWQLPIHAADRPTCRERWHEALETGRMLQMECRLWNAAERAYRWHLCRAVPEEGAGGGIVSWLGTFTDIEDQKRAQCELADFKATLDAVLDAVMIFEPVTWKFLYVNHGARALFSDAGERLPEMRPHELMAGYDEARFRELLAPLQEGSQRAVTVETTYRRADGREVAVEMSFQFVRVDGGHMVSIARDITERKLVEMERAQLYGDALAAIQARDEFLSVASHELRTPLSSLRLQIEMLLRPPGRSALRAQPLPDKTREKLERMDRLIGRLTALIGGLMDVSRITAGKLTLEPEDLDLTALVGEVVARFKDDAAKAGCTTTVDAPGPVPGRWDRMRLEQVVTNLLTNALKYAAGQPVEIAVGRSGSGARLTVRDHGSGIAALDVERIFERFERASSSTKQPGLGLGLYIVRQIVAAHGGTIRVDSQPDAGTIFTVELPFRPPPRDRDAPGVAGDGDGALLTGFEEATDV